MSRPSFTDIVSAIEGWDAEISSDIGILKNFPWPVFQADNTGAGYANVAAFAAAFPASSYDRCVAFVKFNDILPAWGFWYSDGANWLRITGGDHGAAIHLSADQAIPTATLTRIDLDTTESDPDSLYDSTNKAIKIKLPGTYLIEALITFAADAAGTYREAHLFAAGAAVRLVKADPGATNERGMTLTKRVVLAANDLVQLKAKHDKGANLNVLGNGTSVPMRCSVSVQRVAQAG